MEDTRAPGEPLPETLGRAGDAPSFRRYLLASRPGFYPASLLPVVVGTAWGVAVADQLDLLAAVLAGVATVLVHGAANAFNDVGDDVSGSDARNTGRIYPYTGGSRFIQNGVMSRREMTRLSGALLAIAVMIGLGLSWFKGPTVLWFGLTGVLLAIAYSMPSVRLSDRGLGELTVGIAFGVVPVVGAAWLQSGQLDMGAFLISLPTGAWVSAILLINEVPDLAADSAAGKRTLPVRVGRSATRYIYAGLHAIGLAALTVMVYQGLISAWALAIPVGLSALVVFAAAGITAQRERLTKSIKATLAVQAVGSLWLTIAALVFV
jgi:1,4-dihydroxy-2-naphthoate octaprenyltransferase